MRRSLPLLALTLLLVASLPAPAGGTDHGEDAMEAPPWFAGYRYGLLNEEDGYRRTYALGGIVEAPDFLEAGDAFLLVRTVQDGGGTSVDFMYLHPEDRTVLGRQRTTAYDDRVERATYRYEPPLDLYPFPLEPGMSWTVNSTEHVHYNITYYPPNGGHRERSGIEGRWRAEFHVGNWTMVNTTFGNFTTLPVEEKRLDPVWSGQRRTLVHHLSPEARHVVLIEDHRGGYRDGTVPWRTYELTNLNSNLAPVAAPHATTLRTWKNETVVFDGHGSYDVDDGLVNLTWTLGDGTNATGPEVEHAYALPGRYEVTLEVEDARGLTAERSLTVDVRSRRPIPVVDVPKRVDVGETFNLSAEGSHDPDGEVTSWTWRFHDGSVARGANITYRFGNPGTFPIALEVVDDDGVRSIARVTLAVGEDAPHPGEVRVNLTAPVDAGEAWGRTHVTWNVTGPATVLILEVDGWTIWDGPPEAVRTWWNATAEGEGLHRVTLLALDPEGNVHADTVNVNVTPPPEPEPPTPEPDPRPTPDANASATNDTGPDPTERPLPHPAPAATLVAVAAASLLASVRARRKV